MTNRRVVITGMGIVAPGGNNLMEFKETIFSGTSAIGEITRFDSSEMTVKVAAEVKNFEASDFIPIAIVRKTDRFAQLGLVAAAQAIRAANLESSNILRKASVIIGSGLGGSLFHEETIVEVVESGSVRKTKASAVPRITPNAVSAYIAIHNQIMGCNKVISTACSSGTQAIGEAFQSVRRGDVDLSVTGGVEAPVSKVNMAMYQAMMALGTALEGEPIQSASRPFDKTRNGFVMGEGGAILILEELEHALKRNANIEAEVIGFGSTCGAYHMVAPNPSGEDAKETMILALKDSKHNLSDVDYVNAHGTSTTYNDAAETEALKKLFGSRARKVPVSGIKSMIGHTIGASGAIQAVATCLSLKYGILAPTINLRNPDPECDLDYVANIARDKQVNVALSNSFGFGSNNACLVLKKFK